MLQQFGRTFLVLRSHAALLLRYTTMGINLLVSSMVTWECHSFAKQCQYIGFDSNDMLTLQSQTELDLG
jgi:hypothetical protein